jgi:hypothetical protein
MAASSKTTAKVDLTEQLDITTLREQILSTSNRQLLIFIPARRLT